MLKFLEERETALQEERDAFQAELDDITSKIEARDKQPTDEEFNRSTELFGLIDAKDSELSEVRGNIAKAREAEERKAAEAEVRKQNPGAESRVKVGDEPKTYRKDDPIGNSWVRDMMNVGMNRGDVRGATERLQRNTREVLAAEQRALSTTDTAGGDFVPPLYMVEQYIALARTARPTADRVQNMTLPGGTDSFNVPKISTGTAVAEQATQNTAVQNTDAVTASVAVNVATLAGQQVVAVQLIEQSPISMDSILLQDLALDYAAKVDLYVLNNNAAGKKGLLQEAGTNAVTYTSGAPTVALLWPKLADAVQQVTTNRFLPPDTVVMHPRRWAYLLAAVDSSSRPLITATPGQGPTNSLGTSTGVAAANGVVGNIMGLDVILDPQIPTNLGAGTNQDPIIVLRASDSILWEGTPHAEAFRETKADQLSVLLRFYRYAAFTTARYAKSVSVINGTGLVAPTF